MAISSRDKKLLILVVVLFAAAVGAYFLIQGMGTGGKNLPPPENPPTGRGGTRTPAD